MATENAQQMSLEEPELTAQEVAAAPVVEAPLAAEETSRSLALQEQERRLQAVRDINVKIGELEENIAKLTANFGHSQESLNTSIADLQRRSTQMAADVVGVVGRIDRSAQHHAEATRALDSRVKAAMGELNGRLEQADGSIRNQENWLTQLEASQDALQKLHAELTSTVQQQDQALNTLATEAATRFEAHDADLQTLHALSTEQQQALGAFAEETRDQIQINRTHIQGLNALHREQRQSLDALRTDFDLLIERTNGLADQLANLAADAAAHRGQTRKNFITVAGAMVATALTTFAVIAYLQYHPTTVPEATKAQLAAMSSTIQQQGQTQQALSAHVQGLQTHVDALDSKVAEQGQQIETMGKAIDRSSALLHRLQKSETTTKQKVGTLEHKVAKLEAPAK